MRTRKFASEIYWPLKSCVEEIPLPKIKYYFKGGLILNHVNLKFSGNFWWWDVVSDQAIFKLSISIKYLKYLYLVLQTFKKLCEFSTVCQMITVWEEWNVFGSTVVFRFKHVRFKEDFWFKQDERIG